MRNITLTDKVTGYSRTFEDTADDFWWEEGNGSCDCNRSLFLYEWDEAKELQCSSDENQIEIVIEK